MGKATTHEIEHGKIGAEMGKRLGLSQAITDIMEKHIRGGLTEDEARELGLPVKDYTLKTLEEKISHLCGQACGYNYGWGCYN